MNYLLDIVISELFIGVRNYLLDLIQAPAQPQVNDDEEIERHHWGEMESESEGEVGFFCLFIS